MCSKTDGTCIEAIRPGQLHVEIETRDGKIYQAHAAPDQQCYQHDPGRPLGRDIVRVYSGTRQDALR